MTTTLTEIWARIRTSLDAHAPSTARTVRTSASVHDIYEAQTVMGQTFPDEVTDQLLLFDGAEPIPITGVLLPPLYIPVSIQRMQLLWQRKRVATATSLIADEGIDVAGEPCRGFHPLLVPIGDDTTGDLLVVDNRPGELRGSVLDWSRDDGLINAPIWHSVTEMWADVAGALEGGSTQCAEYECDPPLTHNGCAALFTADGTLEWEF